MKNKKMVLGLIIISIVIFFPYTVKTVFSGDGEIQDQAGEKTGECILSVEISETRSLFLSYKKSFTYKLGDTVYEPVEAAGHSEAGDLNFISQWHQNKNTGELDMRSLEYPDDFSYAVITVGTERYYLKNDEVTAP